MFAKKYNFWRHHRRIVQITLKSHTKNVQVFVLKNPLGRMVAATDKSPLYSGLPLVHI